MPSAYPTINLQGEGYAVVNHVKAEDDVLAHESIRGVFQDALADALGVLCDAGRIAADTKGDGLYTGRGGVAYALKRVLDTPGAAGSLPAGLLEKVRAHHDAIVVAVDPLGMRRVPSYLEGRAGLHALLAASGYHADDNVVALTDLARPVLDMPPGECELLYGRAGYLYALLSVLAFTSDRYRPRFREIITRLVRQIEQAGKNKHPTLPLMYEWHGKGYLGAAHGVCGILYVLLQCPREVLEAASASLPATLRAAVLKVAELCLPTGNYPSSLNTSAPGRLNQFCHGSPGFVMLFAKAAEVFDDRPTFLPLAERSAEYLKDHVQIKGVGLCHGVAGSIYPLLALYRAGGNIKWLRHATHLTMYLCHEYPRMYRYSDRPLSLFEGLAGMVCLIADMLSGTPSQAKFPAFDVDG